MSNTLGVNGGSALPLDSFSLIENLDKVVRPPIPTVESLSTDEGRIRLAFELGKRELVDALLLRVKKMQEER